MTNIIQNTTLEKPLKTRKTPLLLDETRILNNLDYTEQEAKNSKPLFSYYISADNNDSLQDFYQDLANQARQNLKNYLSTKVIKSKDGIQLINYHDRVKRDKNEEINYKNSFLKLSYEVIPNSCPIFTTITLPSLYHVGESNPLINTIQDSEKLQDMKEFIHYKGYKKITDFNRRLYKNQVFKTGKLDKNNRSSITALEPHKDWTAHQHQLQFINADYFMNYIKTFVFTALDEQLGRTQIVVTKDKLELIKKEYELVIKVGKNGTNEYFIKDTYIFFQEFIISEDNEQKSVSNYLTSYIETKHIVEPNEKDSRDEQNKKKKNKSTILNYDGWAYYIAHLKDKYEHLDYGKKHKKIRRINYTQLLISRSVYKRVMNKNFIEYLASINELDTKNMYYSATKMMMNKKLKVYKYHEVFDRSQGYPKYEKHNVNYISITYKDYHDLIDCKCFDIYDVTEHGQMNLIHKIDQIDLGKDDFIIKEYKLRKDGTKIEFDVAI